jgi:multidrug ABC transporter, ATPase/permease protein
MTKQPKKKPKYKSTIRRTLYYFLKANSKYKWLALGVLIITPIVIFVRTILAPLVVANIIDILSSAKPEDFVNSGNIFQIPLVQKVLPQGIFLFLCQLIGSGVLSNLRVYLAWKMELLTINDLSIKCFDTVNNQSMQFHSDRFSGSLTAQVGRFTRAYERFADSIIFNIMPLIVTFSSIFVILINRAPSFAILLMIFSIIFAIVSSKSFKRIGECNEKEAAAQNKQTGQLTDSITNILSVKSYAQENYERSRYTKFQSETLAAGENSMRATIHRDVIFDSIFLLIYLLMIIFIVIGAPVMTLPISTVILIFQFSQTILMSLWDVSSIFKNFTRVFGDAHEMTIILDTVDTVVDEKGAKKLIVDKGAINFDHINFRHADAKEDIFHDFDLKIKPGERVGLAGLSGSGKTTLTKLLLRFADVDQGAIKIDDQNIRKVTQHSLRKNIAYVPQEASLFHRSIADNIAYAKPDATITEIQHAAKLANAAEFIEKLPNGYETMVGERGIKLSGGQRQRIAIARAILKDAPILVLDEATSALDSESESLIQEALLRLMHGRTSIVVAHRLSTISSLDRIIVLDNGQIIEQGSHDELLKIKGGQYKKLWSRQSGAFVEETK